MSGLPTQEEEEEEQTGKLAVRLANAAVLPMVLKSAIELKIIDIISTATGSGAYLSPSEIAALIPAVKNPEAPVLLDRMLRVLASYDILKCRLCKKENIGDVERVYGASAICNFLTEQEGSVAPLLSFHHDEVIIKSWYHLNDAILEGGIPFTRAHGMTIFEYAGTDQRFNTAFNKAMSHSSNLIMKRILDIYKGFDGLKSLVDVGGGSGATLNLIRTKYPEIKCINFDLPHVFKDAPCYAGVEHIGGDMFERVPEAEAVYLKRMLHGFSDEQCLKLLKNCWEALPSNGKVIAVDYILPEAPDNTVASHTAFAMDLLMLTQSVGGKERTKREFAALATKSSFSGYEVICCAYNWWVMEFLK